MVRKKVRTVFLLFKKNLRVREKVRRTQFYLKKERTNKYTNK